MLYLVDSGLLAWALFGLLAVLPDQFQFFYPLARLDDGSRAGFPYNAQTDSGLVSARMDRSDHAADFHFGDFVRAGQRRGSHDLSHAKERMACTTGSFQDSFGNVDFNWLCNFFVTESLLTLSV